MNAPILEPDGEHEVVVKVSLTTIYGKLLEIDGIVRGLPAITTDHEARIRIVEKAQSFAAGRSVVFGALAGALAGWLIGKLTGGN